MASFTDNFNAGTPAALVSGSANWASASSSPNRLTYQTGSWGSQGALQEAAAAAVGDLWGEGANLPATANQRVDVFVALSTQAGATPTVEVRLRWDTTDDRYVGCKVYESKVEIRRNGVVLATLTHATTHTAWQGWIRFEAVEDNLRVWWEDVNFATTPNFARVPDLEALDLVVTMVGAWGVQVLRSGIDTWAASDLTGAAPTTPSITTKTDLNTLNLVPVTLTCSAFVDADPSSFHAATRWQIDVVGGNFDPPQIDDEIDTINLTVRTFFLQGSTDFDARVTYQDQDDNWSAWSAVFSFATIAAFTPGSGTPPTLPPSVFPALSQNPSYEFQEGYQSETLVSSGDTGVERRRSKLSVPKRVFTFRYKFLGQTDADLLWDFFLLMNGKFTAFQYTHPISGEVIPVRFTEDFLSREYFEYQLYTVGISLVELYTPDSTDILP